MQAGEWSVIIALACATVYLYVLESRYATCVEYGCARSKTMRIDPGHFQKNPFREIKRYIEDANYYNNIWRVVAIATNLVCLSIIGLVCIAGIDVSLYYIFPFLWLSIYTLLYNTWNYKQHHFNDFINKSVKDALEYLDRSDGMSYAAKRILKGKAAYRQPRHA